MQKPGSMTMVRMTCAWQEDKRSAERDAERLSCAWRKGGFSEVIKVKGELGTVIERVVDSETGSVERADGSDDDEEAVPAVYVLDHDESEPVLAAGIEVEQESSSCPIGDPRSPNAKRIWVR